MAKMNIGNLDKNFIFCETEEECNQVNLEEYRCLGLNDNYVVFKVREKKR